jgi:hypothetical protein
MGVIMPAIIDQAGRNFNVDEADGVSGRDNHQSKGPCSIRRAGVP